MHGSHGVLTSGGVSASEENAAWLSLVQAHIIYLSIVSQYLSTYLPVFLLSAVLSIDLRVLCMFDKHHTEPHPNPSYIHAIIYISIK